jgi:hypothetical protein
MRKLKKLGLIADEWIENEKNILRLLYNKTTFREKFDVSIWVSKNWAKSDTTIEKIWNTSKTFLISISLVYIFIPSIYLFDKHIKKDWCEKEGFFCDSETCKEKHYSYKIKNRINKAWENLQLKQTLEAL